MLELDLTLEVVLSKPTMRTVFKDENAQVGFSVVKVLVQRFLDSFGFNAKASNSLIEIITVDTLDRFSYESLEDVILFFKMARSGYFGTTSRGVDSNLIFGEWFPMYLTKKAELRETKYTEEKGVRLSDKTSIEDVQKYYMKKHMIKSQQQHIENVKLHIEHITKEMDRETLENTIVDWSKDKEKNKFIRYLKEKRKIIK